ncbi:hypothetical protein ACHAXM_000858 [Skeletonema potamos]|jgi:dephospho-CoA kinase
MKVSMPLRTTIAYFLPLLIITICTRLQPSSAFQPTSSSASALVTTLSSISSSFRSTLKSNRCEQKIISQHQRRQNRLSWSPLFGAAAVDYNKTALSVNKMKVLGICGGIGSGKSTACQLMVDKLGCVARIDADKLAHCVYEPGSQSLQEIVAEFGKNVLLSGDSSDDHAAEIDRQKLGAIVFSDPKAMSKLERIVWPHVRTRIEERIKEITTEYQSSQSTTSDNEIIIVEAALLLETDWHDMLDGLWVVQASPSVAVKRLMENRGLTEEDALVRIRAQKKRRSLLSKDEDGECTSDELRNEIEMGIVTAVVTNDGTLDELQNALEKTLCDATAFKRDI